jgi:hypothetical protein
MVLSFALRHTPLIGQKRRRLAEKDAERGFDRIGHLVLLIPPPPMIR